MTELCNEKFHYVYSAPYTVSMNDIGENRRDGACSMYIDVCMQTIARTACKLEVTWMAQCTDGRIIRSNMYSGDWICRRF